MEIEKIPFLKRKIIYIPVSIILFTLILMCPFYLMAIGTGHIRTFLLINVAFSFIAMIISAILFTAIAVEKVFEPKQSLSFQLCWLAMFFYLFSIFLKWTYRPNVHQYTKYIIDTNVYLMTHTFLFAYKKYLKETLSKKTKLFTILEITGDILFYLSLIIIITNPFTRILSYYENAAYQRSPNFWIFYIFIFYVLFTNILFTVLYSTKSIEKKITFSCITVSAFFPIIYHLNHYGVALTEQTLFLSLFLIYINVQKEEQIELEQKRTELTQAQMDIMLSQIQPHFVYNSLATISALCDFDPKLAQNAVERFSNYLKMNLYSIKCKDNISFKKELEHIQTYLWLEELRFENRLTINYDIKCSDFEIPPLSVQPIVENAVKHGICPKPEGGKITISTDQNEKEYVISVEDNGVGFSVEELEHDNKVHIGTTSVKDRIQYMCHGSVTINSVINKGTTVQIRIPKKRTK